MARDITLTLSVSVRVNADDWLLAYGTEDTDQALRADVANLVPDVVKEAAESRFLAMANGTQVTGIRIDTIGIAPDVLAAELVADHPGNTRDYPYVRAWGAFMGSFDGYIREQVEKARRTNAPATATFHRDPEREGGPAETNGWNTVEGILNPRAIEFLRSFVEREAARR